MFLSKLEKPSTTYSALICLVLTGTVMGGCSNLDRARRAADMGIETTHALNIAVLVEAETERQRMRRARCYSPLLNPAAISAGALDPRLGKPWLHELMRDCPEFSALVAQLIVEQSQKVAASWIQAHAADPLR